MDAIPDRNEKGANAPSRQESFTIGDLATEFDITTRAIRFYEAKGLIAPERERGARIYSRRDRVRLTLILRGKRLGYRLDDIRTFLDLYNADRTQTAQLTFVKEKVAASIAELEQKRQDIDATLTELKELARLVDEEMRDTKAHR